MLQNRIDDMCHFITFCVSYTLVVIAFLLGQLSDLPPYPSTQTAKFYQRRLLNTAEDRQSLIINDEQPVESDEIDNSQVLVLNCLYLLYEMAIITVLLYLKHNYIFEKDIFVNILVK